jgi:cytochrome subunit of sulfide dehydrogenase
MMPPFAPWISASLFIALAGQLAAAELDRGAQLAATCASCHRLDGRDTGIPSIIGLDAGKLADMMQAFKSNESSSHIMHTVSLSLSDDEIRTVARYLAARGKEAKSP